MGACLFMDAEPSPANFLFCASFCSVMSVLSSRSTSFFSWSCACTQHEAAVNNVQAANNVRTPRGCPSECWFVKQIPLKRVGTVIRQEPTRVFIVLGGSATDNARMAEHVY